MTRANPAAMPAVSSGSTNSAASPHTSGNEPARAATTGTPSDIASSGGMPHPSSREGKASATALARTMSRISSST
jgi:hypothetical protein